MTTFEFIVHGVGITSVGFAGLLANIVCLLVLNQPALRRGRQVSCSEIGWLPILYISPKGFGQRTFDVHGCHRLCTTALLRTFVRAPCYH